MRSVTGHTPHVRSAPVYSYVHMSYVVISTAKVQVCRNQQEQSNMPNYNF